MADRAHRLHPRIARGRLGAVERRYDVAHMGQRHPAGEHRRTVCGLRERNPEADGGPQVTFTIIDAKPNHGFVDETKLPLARMRFEHEVASDAERTRITHRVQITGPAAPLFARVIGRGIARDLPETIAALAQLASERGARKVVVA